ncbi:uncharacterized protein LOC127757006 [Oryza glaberrima]|uniref:uncharacterized protein LOC127757006 n=1 Tax=Oryza glaberrima TaxID=4538 RepID=UPI00224C2DCE|nr:uncharacterized protein LOC127757006 [Oryza glaberrima]
MAAGERWATSSRPRAMVAGGGMHGRRRAFGGGGGGRGSVPGFGRPAAKSEAPALNLADGGTTTTASAAEPDNREAVAFACRLARNDGAIRLIVIPTTSVVDHIGIYGNDGGGGEEEVLSIVVHDDDPDNSRGLVPGDNLTVCGRGFVVGYGESEAANPPLQPSIS